MTKKQKEKIEAAITEFSVTSMLYARNETKENHKKMLEARNALYEAIGNMEDYKFFV